MRRAEGVRHEVGVIFKSKLGWMGVTESETGISRVVLPTKDKKSVEKDIENAKKPRTVDSPVLRTAVHLLRNYFSGERVSFDVNLDVRYYTPFQRAVWKAAAAIPYGETRSYAWIAKRIKKPLAARAVGQAMGANPIPIIIP